LKLFENGDPRRSFRTPQRFDAADDARDLGGENGRARICTADAEEWVFVPREARLDQAAGNRKSWRATRLIVGAGVCAIALGRGAGPARHPLHHRREECRARRHLVRQPLPGCGVDTPNHSYSFLVRRAKSVDALFAKRQELLDYLKKVALEYDIPKASAPQYRTASSRWDEEQTATGISDVENG